MKNTMITEFVQFKALDSATEEQLLAKVETLNDFLKKQDGFIDGELVKSNAENDWHLVYHYESMEKVMAIGEKMRSSKVFEGFMPITVPGSVRVTFHQQLKTW